VAISKLYSAAKLIALAVMFSSYLTVLATLTIANSNNGWIVVCTNSKGEGTIELAALLACLPPATYVTYREAMQALRALLQKRRTQP